MTDPFARIPGHRRVTLAWWVLTALTLAALLAFALRP